MNDLPRFSSSIEDIEGNPLDLNRYLIKHKAATFYIQMESDNLNHEGIYKNDLLMVDRSLDPGKIVIAVINGNFNTYKVIHRNKDLLLANDLEEPFSLNKEVGDYIWGSVIAVIRKL